MKDLFRKMINLGAAPGLSAPDLRLLRYLNTVLFVIEVFILMNACLGIAYYNEGGRSLVLFNVLHFLMISPVFLLNHYRQYLSAKILFCSAALLFVSIYAVCFGERGFAGFFLAMLNFLYFSIFSKKEIKPMIILTVLTVSSFAYTMYRYENNMWGLENLSDEFIQMFRLNNLFGFIGLSIAFGYYSFVTVNHTEESLEFERHKSEELLDHFLQGVNYAKRIQTALLGNQAHITAKFKDAFILYKPKDIVSGDFYWYHEDERHQVIVAADCTGHGVPGAFMTILGMEFLNDLVRNRNIVRPGQLLSELNKKVLLATQQQSSEMKINDGMDVSVVTIDKKEQKAWVAGANNPVFCISEGELVKIKGSKFPIGSGQYDQKVYAETEVSLKNMNQFYLFSDGYQDQFGGDENKKYMTKRFAALLASIHPLGMDEQLKKLETELNSWKQEYEQTDDILVIGLRV